MLEGIDGDVVVDGSGIDPGKLEPGEPELGRPEPGELGGAAGDEVGCEAVPTRGRGGVGCGGGSGRRGFDTLGQSMASARGSWEPVR